MATQTIGAARITSLIAGEFQWSLDRELNVPVVERSSALEHFFITPARMPATCFLIQTDDVALLVDSCDITTFAGTRFTLPEPQTAQTTPQHLTALGIAPETITHVVITHGHYDHYSALTTERDGALMPAFPNARHFLGRGDWEHPELLSDLANPDSLEWRTLGTVQRAGLLDLVDAPMAICPGLDILPAPGETPGHLIVRLRSDGESLYCTGDLYHHPVEIDHPLWMPRQSDIPANLASRAALVEAAVREDALIAAA
ncbi:MAG TPA: MBL fold metallo-hydrolase, partial [Ktedonobacterales bacterium]|nr:MBL fold metallo-hydrolase [Ktedonobacterales bacterium]